MSEKGTYDYDTVIHSTWDCPPNLESRRTRTSPGVFLLLVGLYRGLHLLRRNSPEENA